MSNPYQISNFLFFLSQVPIITTVFHYHAAYTADWQGNDEFDYKLKIRNPIVPNRSLKTIQAQHPGF